MIWELLERSPVVPRFMLDNLQRRFDRVWEDYEGLQERYAEMRDTAASFDRRLAEKERQLREAKR